eukprot:CAMPEP_0196759132 /NCGR_PEP_ID=MMETSP1091-20130531/104545_1 /TAXON_ID=302021 /ORGANISM="Rhodomonas sp., Strain CCMP768" /LENGTH=120 /DNA_ID=CAMNT_0042107977 /DNA_START=181 /DNA_END=543 /DNA_ORIENTATION=-
MGCGASAQPGGKLDLISPTTIPESKAILEQYQATGAENSSAAKASSRKNSPRPETAASAKKVPGISCYDDPGDMVAEPGVRTGPYENIVSEDPDCPQSTTSMGRIERGFEHEARCPSPIT